MYIVPIWIFIQHHVFLLENWHLINCLVTALARKCDNKKNPTYVLENFLLLIGIERAEWNE
jgi:hypothetical protein